MPHFKTSNQEAELSKFFDLNLLQKNEQAEVCLKKCVDKGEIRYFYLKFIAFHQFFKEKVGNSSKIVKNNNKKKTLRSAKTRENPVLSIFKDKYLKVIRIFFGE